MFVSCTFRDMAEERHALMSHTWPALRRLCRDRHVELVEVDLRWGITEAQSKRRETLKLCLDEIRACRPFFVGLLGERYGWIPPDEAFTADLLEEQPWIDAARGRSTTEMEILHGVLNEPALATQTFFYFRDPAYASDRGPDFLPESAAAAASQEALKARVRQICDAARIPLHEPYDTPRELASLVLADLTRRIEAQFPEDASPDSLTREAQHHEAFADSRRRTFIGRAADFAALDRHAAADDGPLAVMGESGIGKSALLANWLARWRDAHPADLVVEHYVGGAVDSANHWRLIARVIGEIKSWSGDPAPVPTERDDLLADFPAWLGKARARADRLGVRVILAIDAVDTLEDHDRARLLAWVPDQPFRGPLRLVVSTLPGAVGTDDPVDAIERRRWRCLRLEPLTVAERGEMVRLYLARFGKRLDDRPLARLASAPPAANPLYLRILLDDLRVTGTYERLDQRLDEYLAAPDTPALLRHVFARYQRDYERDRPGLVADALGLIHVARRGLSEAELLELLRPAGQARLAPATWAPLRAALEDALVDRGGVLDFAHDVVLTAAGQACALDGPRREELRLRLIDYFDAQPIATRSSDELPWLLKGAGANARLRVCLLDIDRFAVIYGRDRDELRGYWVDPLQELQAMGRAYVERFEAWALETRDERRIAYAAHLLGEFLHLGGLHAEAEPLMRRALDIDRKQYGEDAPDVATDRNNLAALLLHTHRFAEAEPLLRSALASDERSFGPDATSVAVRLDNLAHVLYRMNRLAEAEPLMRRALAIFEARLGPEAPEVAVPLNGLAQLLTATNRPGDAEPLMRRALEIAEHNVGPDHPDVARLLNNLAMWLKAQNRLAESEALLRRALDLDERSYGPGHPSIAIRLNNLAQVLQAGQRFAEAEPLLRRAVAIDEHIFGESHPAVAICLSNLALLLKDTNRFAEAERLFRRVIAIDEASVQTDPGTRDSRVRLAQALRAGARYGEAELLLRDAVANAGSAPDAGAAPALSAHLNNLAVLLTETRRYDEAEPLLRRALERDERTFGSDHPNVAVTLGSLGVMLNAAARHTEAEPLLRRALAIHEGTFGPDDPRVGTDINNLAQVLKDTSRFAQAEPLFRRALTIAERALGAQHPSVAIRLSNLASLLQTTNRMSEAEPLLRRALEIEERAFGADHAHVAGALNSLATLLFAANRTGEAEPLMRRALAIDERIFGRDHARVATDLNNLSTVMFVTNRLEEAESLIRRALAIDERHLADHPDLARDLTNLATLLQATDRVHEAEPLLRRALTIQERRLGTDHPSVASTLNGLGGVFYRTRRLQEAETLVRRALDINERRLGPAHPEVAGGLNNLAALLHAGGRDIDAEPLMRRALQILAAFSRATGHRHAQMDPVAEEYRMLLQDLGYTPSRIAMTLRALAPDIF